MDHIKVVIYLFNLLISYQANVVRPNVTIMGGFEHIQHVRPYKAPKNYESIKIIPLVSFCPFLLFKCFFFFSITTPSIDEP